MDRVVVAMPANTGRRRLPGIDSTVEHRVWLARVSRTPLRAARFIRGIVQSTVGVLPVYTQIQSARPRLTNPQCLIDIAKCGNFKTAIGPFMLQGQDLRRVIPGMTPSGATVLFVPADALIVPGRFPPQNPSAIGTAHTVPVETIDPFASRPLQTGHD